MGVGVGVDVLLDSLALEVKLIRYFEASGKPFYLLQQYRGTEFSTLPVWKFQSWSGLNNWERYILYKHYANAGLCWEVR